MGSFIFLHTTDFSDFCIKSIKLLNFTHLLRNLYFRYHTLCRTEIHRYEMRRESTEWQPESFKSYFQVFVSFPSFAPRVHESLERHELVEPALPMRNCNDVASVVFPRHSHESFDCQLNFNSSQFPQNASLRSRLCASQVSSPYFSLYIIYLYYSDAALLR